MPIDPRLDSEESRSDRLTNAEGTGLPPNEAMPGVGASPEPEASGEDAGDAARRQAGADPAATDADAGVPSLLLPTPD
jgi:hypothetical protein